MMNVKRDCRVAFLPDRKIGIVERGTILLEAARRMGVAIESLCGGKASCGKCRIIVETGNFREFVIESKRSSLGPVTEDEIEMLGKEEVHRGSRLACAARVHGDVVVTVPRIEAQLVRKDAGEIKASISPAVRNYYVEVAEPGLGGEGDLERLLGALGSTHGLGGLEVDPLVLRSLPEALRKGKHKMTVSVWQDRELIRAVPGERERAFGLAVDIGTTTLAGYLTDLETGQVVGVDSTTNPQVAFGEDVMSRITYGMMHRGGVERMRDCLLEALDRMLKNAAEEAGINREDVLDIVVVGNTCMHHLFLGIDPGALGVSPFSPATLGSVDARGRELGLGTGAARVHVLPVKAGFVGADCLGAILTTRLHASKKPALLLDIGTNGEIVLGGRERLLCASCATGPAFEGAHITQGMRASYGAIEGVKIDPESLEVELKVIGGEDARPRGICGSGIISAVFEMLRAGVIDRKGMLKREFKGRFVLAGGKESGTGRGISVTQEDIKTVQLAKAALYAGCRVLMERYGIDAPGKVLLAGAFGSHIDRRAALGIGMFPECDLRKISAAGNAAGDGARMALLDRRKRKEAGDIAKRMEYVELTLAPEFQNEFVRGIPFPAP